jgi:hypothetical protein
MLSQPPDSTWAPPCSPLYFPFLTFNKLHLYPHVLRWILPAKHKELRSLLITDSTISQQHLQQANQELKGKMLCLLICFLLTHPSLSIGPVPLLYQDSVLPQGPGDASPGGQTMLTSGTPPLTSGPLTVHQQSRPEHAAGRCWDALH